jgi:hypothetical protein
MKIKILLFLSALIVFSCKKDKSDVEPVAFRLLTRQVVLLSNTTYMFKGTIISQNNIQMREGGFLYTANTAFNSSPVDYFNSNTIKIPYFKGGTVTPGNYETQVLLVSGKYYNVVTYAVVYNSATQKDEVYTGSQMQFLVP